ncbi:pyrokinin-1 receptor-like [Toxorhynchites rutilus septentrionalis]|uniref:pyrokinin-1 receptor-like n=1 Tax=Toxorhynchites rutilus septentrionalis TaxID=329112 RepID=UPI00247B0D6D|nr:pyrokinin-1 receptor-like [Toxorhynchites rutilus septentrionalis]XP_055616115.1 pyrokinin-1 receptor-like [Toxorhynchites rutilus septentrionalis]XP_055616116.1 pyrokinin-1 receptor-like [Toxorhynchites rutilus septentrionalis]
MMELSTPDGAIIDRSLVILEFVTSTTSASAIRDAKTADGFDLLASSASGAFLVPSQLDINSTTVAAIEAAAGEHLAAKADPICIILPITIFYCFIFVTGIVGNLAICIVIAKNRAMHTATNYYLFNLAVSDFLLLLFGMPLEVYGTWYPYAYPFNQLACIMTGLLSETATNATVLTITSFTVERYIAICHPFRSHTMSTLSRAVKFVIAIWLVAFGLATPPALQFGVVENGPSRLCTIKNRHFAYAFEVSSFLFFVGPMTVIAALYVLIGIKLRKSKLLQVVKRQGASCGTDCSGVVTSGGMGSSRGVTGQTRVIRMLVAVVTTFFCCWAPFHAQRLMAVYGAVTNTNNVFFFKIYTILTYISGILYYMSTCINPLLYHIMSHKFRDASRRTLRLCCYGASSKRADGQNHTYSALSRYGITGNGGSLKLASNLTYNSGTHPVRPNSEVQLCHQESEMSLLRSDGAGRYSQKPDSHCVSSSSQSTIITTVSNGGRSSSNEKKHPNGKLNHRSSGSFGSRGSIRMQALSSSGGVPSLENGDPSGKLSTIAEKLRRGTKKVLQFSKSPPMSPTMTEPVAQEDKRRWLRKKESVDSVDTNTISNSSLKEYDEEEFSSAELARYMAEVNNEIR